MKKIASFIIAMTMLMALALPAFAADTHNAYIGIADSDWNPSSFSTEPSDCVITGDGQYVVETNAFAGASGLIVFVVDIVGLVNDCPDATAVVDSIEVDGKAVEFDASKVAVGNLEENGNLRIEFYNEFGPTSADPALDNEFFFIDDTVKITFTVSGIDGAAAPVEGNATEDNTAAPVEENNTASSNEDTTSAPSTGLAIAIVPAVVALAAAVVSKKR